MGTNDHVLTVIATDDLAAGVAFYTQVFGWSVAVDTPVYVELLIAPRGQRFGVYDRQAFSANTGIVPSRCEPGGTTGTEVYVMCDDVEATIQRVVAAGGRELAPLAPRPWGDDCAYYADLDGNVLVLARPTAGQS